jgi:hypothetical protein
VIDAIPVNVLALERRDLIFVQTVAMPYTASFCFFVFAALSGRDSERFVVGVTGLEGCRRQCECQEY